MATASQWIAGARPRTLPTAIAPVLVGAGAAAYPQGVGAVVWSRWPLTLLVSVALIVGVNYANDYSDGIRGTDDVRVGPVRLVGQRLATPASVRTAALLSFSVAALAGLTLVLLTGAWWMLIVGAACILAAWGYTGGPRPYGYVGLGEVFVLVFFGFVAVLGTVYVLTDTISRVAVLASLVPGCTACAVLVANNLRDIPTDTATGKTTLAVRLGDPATRTLYIRLLVVTFAVVVVLAVIAGWWPGLGLLALPLALRLVRVIRSGATGRDLIPVLAGTGITGLVVSALLGLGLLIAGG